MRPSEVREQILAEHRRVLSLLDSTGGCARRVAEGRAEAAELQSLARVLSQVLEELLDEEGEILEPELRQVDAWGELRARQLASTHDRHRALLISLREVAEARGVAPEILASRMERVVEAIRSDLIQKEQRFLSPDLLRDDLVIVGQSDG